MGKIYKYLTTMHDNVIWLKRMMLTTKESHSEGENLGVLLSHWALSCVAMKITRDDVYLPSLENKKKVWAQKQTNTLEDSINQV